MNFCQIFRYQNNDHERFRSKFITKIMIINDSPITHYQDNGNEGFLGRLITGNDHSGHDHIHYLQRLFCFALLSLCVNLLYFQWLYLNKVDKV
jgi:hypothetical protein